MDISSTITACIIIQLRPEIFDPQASVIKQSLCSMGFEHVSNLRIHKVIEITLPNTDRNKADSILQNMAERLLTNPVLEEYRIEFK